MTAASFVLKRLPRRQAQYGTALLEILISLLLFAFGILGLIGLEARAINFSVGAEDRNRAALLANEIASSLWLAHSVSVSTTALAAWQAIAADATHTGMANGTVAINPVAGTTNSTDIVIGWKPPSSAASAAADTLTTRVILP